MNKLRCGKGISMNKSKLIYIGDWENDLYHGEGIFNFDNNLTYVGSFLKGKKHGKGKITSEDGLYDYIGDFYNNVKDGLGE